MSEAIIRARGLTKGYGGGRGVQGLDLAVDQGEVFGFLGPNGAGKTTTIRLLMGFIRPDGGTAEVLGAALLCPGRGRPRGCGVSARGTGPDG